MTRSETAQLIKILDINNDGQLDILEFDRMIRKEHRRLVAKSVSSLDSENEQGSTPSLVFSPSRVSTKCPNCEIGRAEPPSERNPRYLRFSRHFTQCDKGWLCSQAPPQLCSQLKRWGGTLRAA